MYRQTSPPPIVFEAMVDQIAGGQLVAGRLFATPFTLSFRALVPSGAHDFDIALAHIASVRPASIASPSSAENGVAIVDVQGNAREMLAQDPLRIAQALEHVVATYVRSAYR